MSAKKTPLELVELVHAYLLEQHPGIERHGFFYCMDTREFPYPDAAFYPDLPNRFTTPLAAMEYLLETGLPIWVCGESTNYPIELFTYRKCKLLFDL